VAAVDSVGTGKRRPFHMVNTNRKEKMKKYKVKITRDTIVEAQNEDEAQDMAFDSLIFGDVDFEIEEYNDK